MQRCYEHAYEKLGDRERRARYGDALMHAGRYSDALRVFEGIGEDASHQSDDNDEAHLDFADARIKGYALTHIRELFGIQSQQRKTRAAQQCLGQYQNISPGEMLARCETAIKADALCNSAWFSRGVTLYEQGKGEEALSSFLVAAAIATNDDRAWLNVLMLALQRQSLDLLAILLLYLTHERGTAFVQYMTEIAQTRSNEKERAMIMELARLLVEQIPKQREEALIRLHGRNGTTVIKGPVR